jgi:hypothetical protein
LLVSQRTDFVSYESVSVHKLTPIIMFPCQQTQCASKPLSIDDLNYVFDSFGIHPKDNARQGCLTIKREPVDQLLVQ